MKDHKKLEFDCAVFLFFLNIFILFKIAMMIIGGYIQNKWGCKVHNVEPYDFDIYVSKRLEIDESGRKLFLKPDKVVEPPKVYDKLCIESNPFLF